MGFLKKKKKKKKHKSRAETAKKEKKAKRTRLHFVIGAILAVFALVFGYRLANSAYFAISRIEVTNNQRISAQRVSEISGVSIGQSLLTVSSLKVNEKVKQEPWIRKVDIIRKLPNVLELKVSERVPIAMLGAANGRFLMDRDSVVIALAQGETLPIIVAEGVKNAEVNKRVDNAQFQVGLSYIASMPEQMQRQMQEVRVDSQNKIIAMTTGGTQINYGDLEDVDKKNYVLNVFLTKAKVERQKFETIDLRVPANPVVKKAAQ